jgi:hypothetical protein
VLDAWGLTAEDAAGIMDQMVASHQEYGGSIADNQRALAALAPQLRALNVTTTDAIGLLNLFAASGMDSAKATFALNTAVKNLKPGQNLDDLIAKISAIEDPTLRAQEAIKVFGARGGVAMANILRPGIKGLSDFAIKAEDVTSATEDAAQAIEDSLGNRAKMALKGFNGVLAEVGTNMGDLLMIGAILGPSLTRGLLAALGGLGGIVAAQILGTQAAAVGASAAVGTASGTALGGALAVAAALAVPAAIAAAIGLVGVGIALWIDKAAPGLAESMNRNFFAGVEAVGRWFSGGQLAGEAARQGFQYGFQTGDVTGPARRFGPMTNALVPEAKAAFVPVGEAAVDGLNIGIVSGFEDTKDTGKALAGAVSDGYLKGAAGVKAAAKRTVEDVRLAIVEGKGGIVSAWRDAMNERNTAANAADQIIINNAEIAAAKKIRDNTKLTAAERAEARIRIRNLLASNSELLVQQSQYGTRAEQIAKTKALLTSKALLKGLKDKDPDVRQHWIDVKTTLETQLGNLGAKGETYGAGFAEGMLKGLKSRNAEIAAQARRLQNLLNLHNRREFGGPVTAGTPYIVGERRAEVFVPDTNGTIIPSVPAGFGQGGGGLSLTVNVTASGDTSLGQARRFGQAVLDEVANGLRQQTARYAR